MSCYQSDAIGMTACGNPKPIDMMGDYCRYCGEKITYEQESPTVRDVILTEYPDGLFVVNKFPVMFDIQDLDKIATYKCIKTNKHCYQIQYEMSIWNIEVFPNF